MLGWIVSVSLRLRVLVIALAVALLVLGIRSVPSVPLDVFPEFAPPIVEIQTEAPGLSAPEVESLVTVPLEAVLHGTPWLETVRSTSVEGLSSIKLILDQGAELMRARQVVQERLAVAASRLPAVARTPLILPPLSATSRVMKIGVSSSTVPLVELSTLARWTIRPRLLAVPGVANVAIWGQRDRELQVLVDPDRLNANGVTLDQVVRAAGEATVLTSGGFVETPNQRLTVRHASELHGAADLAGAIVAYRGGVALRLGDVADVVVGFPPRIGEGVVNDGPGLLLIVEKEPWGNTLDVTRGVEEALATLAPGLEGVDVDPTIFRPASFIETSLHNLGRALWIGCVLVVLVLLVFLRDWRTALISATAIPLSLVVAVLVLAWYGATINTMVLAGLVIALGEVVDDAIIDVENISRRLRLNDASDSPRPAFLVVLEASLEVRSAVVQGSLIVVLVLVPVFLLPGLAGSFFRPLALAYVLAILASLLVALTLTPALCLVLLPREKPHGEGVVLGASKRVHSGVLGAILGRPRAAAAVLVLSIAATAAAVPALGEEFLPSFQERDFLMHFVERPSIGLDAMTRITERASRELRAIPGVRNFGAHIGRAVAADEVVGPNFTELWISVDPEADYEPTVAHIESVIAGYTGLRRDVLTYLRERIKEVLSGASATVVVRIFGDDLGSLRRHAERVNAALEDVAGVSDLKVEQQVPVPQIQVRTIPEAAARFGLGPADVRRAVTTLVRGSDVGQFFEGQAAFGVAVRGRPELALHPDSLRTLPIDTPTGTQVPLGDVADVSIVAVPNKIQRENASRRIDVTCNVRGRDLGSVAHDVQARLDGVTFERGYHAEVLGEQAAREASQARLLEVGAAVLIGILLILHADFGSMRDALLVLLTLPFALIGGIAGAFLGGGVLSLGSLIGFVTVFGIAVRNAILLVSHYRHLQLVEGMPFGADLVRRGAEERLAPIVMTATTTALALLPLVVAGNEPGHEIEYPMAVVILGGLVTSTALNLLFLPGLVHAFGRPAREVVTS